MPPAAPLWLSSSSSLIGMFNTLWDDDCPFFCEFMFNAEVVFISVIVSYSVSSLVKSKLFGWWFSDLICSVIYIWSVVFLKDSLECILYPTYVLKILFLMCLCPRCCILSVLCPPLGHLRVNSLSNLTFLSLEYNPLDHPYVLKIVSKYYFWFVCPRSCVLSVFCPPLEHLSVHSLSHLTFLSLEYYPLDHHHWAVS